MTSPKWINVLPGALGANQLLIVAQVGAESTAWVSMHEKKEDGIWNMILSTLGFIGRNGLGKKQEGDGKTPVGSFSFSAAFGIAPDPGCKIPYVQADGHTYWSSDIDCRYNEMVDITVQPDLDIYESEHIVDYIREYQYCLNISYNAAGLPGLGSAVFRHCFGDRNPWTAGCVAIPEDKMLFVMRHVDPGCVVIIDSLDNLGGEC